MKQNFLLLAMACLNISLVEAEEIASDKYSRDLRDFMLDSIYDGQNGEFAKVVKEVGYTFVGAEDYTDFVANTFKVFSELTGVASSDIKGVSNEIVEDGLKFKIKDITKIIVAIGKKDKVADVLREYDNSVKLNDTSVVFKKYDSRGVKSAIIVIPTDDITEEEVRRDLLFRLMFVYGIASKTDTASNSIMNRGKEGSSVLTDLDKAMLKFVYTHLETGSRSSKLKKLIRDKWEK